MCIAAWKRKRSTNTQHKNEVKTRKLMVVIIKLKNVAVTNALQLEAVRCRASRSGLFLANYVLRKILIRRHWTRRPQFPKESDNLAFTL